MSQKTNYPYITKLRAMGIISVVSLHTTAQILSQPFPVNTLTFIATDFLDQLLRWSVPIFIMISGALNINPETKFSARLLTKRYLRILIPAFFWITIFFFWVNRNGTVVSPKHYLIQTILYGNPYYHFYFIFVIVGLYSLLPLINLVIRRVPPQVFNLIIAIFFLVPMTINLHTIWFNHKDPRYELNAFTHFLPYIGYFLMGFKLHLLDKIKLKNWKIIGLFLSMVTISAFLTYQLIALYGKNPKGLILTDYLAPNIILCSILLFIHSKKNLNSTPAPAWVTSLAQAAFGIYLSHLLFLETYYNFFKKSLDQPFLMLVSGLGSLLSSWFLVLLLGKIPLVKKIAGY